MSDPVMLSYSETGHGLPVVLLHGFSLNNTIWRHQQKHLGDRFRVIAPDLRGHGKSPAPTTGYEMESLAGDVLALLDRLEIDRAAIMGHSMGGYVTLAAWRLARERFLALGMIASQAGADTEEARNNRFKLVDKVAAEGSAPVAAFMGPRLLAPGRAAGDPLAAQCRQIMLASPPAGIVGSLRALAARPNSEDLLPTIGVPALIVAGAVDQIIPRAKAETMAAAIPHATLEVLENTGHMPMLERPEETSAAMLLLLSSLAE